MECDPSHTCNFGL